MTQIKPPVFGATSLAFLNSDARVRALVGPVGSGKSSVACYGLMRLALSTPACRDGICRSRSIIVRNTYRELVDSTLKTFWRWVPQALGNFSPSDFTFTVADKNNHHQFIFRSFDTAADIGKLLSTEYSYAMLSEARELPVELYDMIPARLRYPTKQHCTDFRSRIIIESNPADPSHWLYTRFVEQRAKDEIIFMQPSGLSPEAENKHNLPDGYYDTISQGKSQAWLDCFVHAKWVFYGTDAAVFPEFIHGTHVARDDLTLSPNLQTLIGIDFGLTPAAAILQRAPSGQYRLIDEIVTVNMGASRFSDAINSYIKEHGLNREQIEFTGDPAGEQRAQTEESTPFQILAAKGINARPAQTNDWTLRRETTARLLTTLDMGGQPALIVSPRCKVTIRGMSGDYRFQRLQVSGSARYSEKPIKTASSHICEAMGYALIGAREDRQLLGVPEWDKQIDQRLNAFRAGTPSEPHKGYKRGAR